VSPKTLQYRTWCSDMLNLCVASESGRPRKLNVILEEIWPTGALFQTGMRIPPLSRLWFSCAGYRFHGRVVARKSYKHLGYFVEMRFDPGCRWSVRHYRPKYFFNPLLLLADRIFAATLRRPEDASAEFLLAPPLSANGTTAGGTGSSQIS
jgi:hypothetical protein